MVTINMEFENVDNTTSVLPDNPTTFPYLVMLVDGVSIPYNNDEFVDFMIMGKKKSSFWAFQLWIFFFTHFWISS